MNAPPRASVSGLIPAIRARQARDQERQETDQEADGSGGRGIHPAKERRGGSAADVARERPPEDDKCQYRRSSYWSIEVAAKELPAVRVCDTDSGEEQQQERHLPARPARRVVTDVRGEPNLLPRVSPGLEDSVEVLLLVLRRRLRHASSRGAGPGTDSIGSRASVLITPPARQSRRCGGHVGGRDARPTSAPWHT